MRRVEPRIVLWDAPDAVRVPLAALYRERGTWHAFIARDGRARTVEVKIGHDDGVQAEVLGGVEAGDRVVVRPSDRVKDGVRIVDRGADQAR